MKPLFLIDLGGVLIDLNWLESARKIFKSDDRESLHKSWGAIKSVRKFESGIINYDSFITDFIGEIDIKVSKEEVNEAFLNIIGDVKANCKSVIDSLKKLGTVAMLSNTNYIHVEKIKKSSELFENFDKVYLSYEMKCVKPDKVIFNKILADQNCHPTDVWFFDDSITNIKSALEMGLNAYQVNNPDDIFEIVAKQFE